MTDSDSERWWQRLRRPSARHSVLGLLLIGALIGGAGVVAFDAALHVTSTEAFCISCHEIEDNAFAQLQKTTHYNNSSGVRATCSDCHVPRAFLPKMVRKVAAVREVWGSITGVIDTPEKYAAHAPVMKRREIARLKASDSRECRDCHEASHMLLAMQTARAREYHQGMAAAGKSCIDCHTGIAHPENAEGLDTGMQSATSGRSERP